MLVNVRMLAFGKPGEIREVEVNDCFLVEGTDYFLDEVFAAGQNDIQAQQHPSVSIGDVIEYDSKLFLVCMVGYKEISEEECDKLARDGNSALLGYIEKN